MRTIEVKVFKFYELSDKAKERAREWWRSVADFAWQDEARQSIEAFCSEFGVTLKDYDVDRLSYEHDATKENFRGRKIREFKRDHMPTGYYLDSDIWETFYDVFKKKRNASAAFDDALYAGFRAWREDQEYQQSDEYIDETIIANEYEFTEEGGRV